MTSTFKAIAIPHKFSLSSYLLKAHSRDQNGRSCTNCGTCFFVALDAQSTLLVTNWHMLTGCDPVTGQRSTGWIGSPDTIDIAVMRQEGETVPFASITTNLYDQGKPNWVEHKSRRKPGYDLAMIRLRKTLELRVMELNLSDIQNGSRIVPGNECFVIGFPFGDSLEYPMSIWKRANNSQRFW